MAKAKKVLCGTKDCDGVIAHQVGDKTFEIKQKDTVTTMTGNNWSAMASCPRNKDHRTSLVVNDGKVDTDSVRYKKQDANDTDEGDDDDEALDDLEQSEDE